MNFYQENRNEIIQFWQTNPQTGLSESEAQARRQKYGENRLQKTKTRQWYHILLEQFNNPLAYILLAAGAFAFYLGEYRDATILWIIVVTNAIFGFYQEWQAENILASLKDLVVDKCTVFRGGKTLEINTLDVVPGDIIYLNEGDGIPADVRLLTSNSLATNDFILTGESAPVDKDAALKIEKEMPLSQRLNCVYMGTTVARGSAQAVVFATGMQTEIGKIARSSADIQETDTPMQKEFAILAQRIMYVALGIAVALFTIRFFTNGDLKEALIFAIGVAAAMVPEGLPAQISVALALGMGRLAKNNAIVKKLASIETLGSATVIASDKTGTITKNQMTITLCELGGEVYTISGTGFEPKGDILDSQGKVLDFVRPQPIDNKPQEISAHKSELITYLWAGFLASTGRINPPDAYHKTWYPIGDPTESAFATLALKTGYSLEEIENQYVKQQIFPFDSFRKRISIVRDFQNQKIAFVKGALESILPICSQFIHKNTIQPLSEGEKQQILELSQSHAAQGLRIIALAIKPLADKSIYTQEEVESDLQFIGFVTMYDPPHDEVKQAIATAFRAHMRVVMITGDNEITAQAIAQQIGMMNENNHFPEVINGYILPKMNDEEVWQKLQARAVVFSRVSPDEKLRIVDIMKQKGEVVAVTGDGVNDTLSLKRADIGVAMGLSGSKVAQESANMVLLDDDFSTIVVAIKEGRTIYKNLEKTVLASVSANIAELSCVLIGFLGAFWGIPIPILAMQILMVDLVGEMFPLLMLTFDPPENNLMEQPPRQPGQYMLNSRSLLSVAEAGVLIGSLSYLAFLVVYLTHTHPNRHYEAALTISYVSIIFGQFANILMRRTERSIFTEYLFANYRLLVGFAFSLFCIMLIVYVPLINEYLHTAPLTGLDWIYPILVAIVFVIYYETKRFFKKK